VTSLPHLPADLSVPERVLLFCVASKTDCDRAGIRRTMRFTGTTVLKVVNGKIVEEIGLDDGVACLTQLGLLKKA
jgi:hypothetical protein